MASRYVPGMRDDTQAPTMSTIGARIARATELLDAQDYDQAAALAEDNLAELTRDCGADWLDVAIPALLKRLADPERGRALARTLWLASTVDELQGRLESARWRCRRAMELYARIRSSAEELDVRAARELGSASHRLGATRPRESQA